MVKKQKSRASAGKSAVKPAGIPAIKITVFGNPGLSVHNVPVIKGVHGADMVTFQHEAYSLGVWGIDFTGVPPGRYTLETGHSEAYTTEAGARLMHVEVNGKIVRRDLDLVAEVGFLAALRLSFPVEPVDGRVELRFIAKRLSACACLTRLRDTRGAVVCEWRADSSPDEMLRVGKAVEVHMIANAHLDPVWLWHWQEGYAEFHATVSSALQRMKETGDLCFTCSSASAYEWIRAGYPEIFQEIQRQVAGGRWELTGGWWVQPDVNLTGGESSVRQGLYAQRFFLEHFGRLAEYGYCVDSFGHHGQLPQILAKSGMKGYVFGRPTAGELSLPGDDFIWEGPDGSRIQGHRLFGWYCTPEGAIDRRLVDILGARPRGQKVIAAFFGLGDHGGGPTRKQIASIQRIAAMPDGPTVKFSTLGKYLPAVRRQMGELPVYRGELQYFARGCYTSVAMVKRLNRQVEKALITAERFAVLAREYRKCEYPQVEFTASWKELCFNQFHDILAGSSLDTAYENVRDELGRAHSTADRIINYSFKQLAGMIDTRGGNFNFIVFNPLPWPRKTLMCVAATGLAPNPLRLVDHAGTPVPYSETLAFGFRRITFLADLPAFGYQVYHLIEGENVLPVATVGNVSGTSFITGGRRVTLDQRTSAILGIVSQQTDLNLFSGPANQLLVMDDRGDAWGTSINEWRTMTGLFGKLHAEVLSNVPGGFTLKRTLEFGRSRATQEVVLHPELAVIPCRLDVQWAEPERMLKLALPLSLDNPQLTAEIPYGNIIRTPDGTEQPMQSWVDVSGTHTDLDGKACPVGLAVLNDGKYGYDCLGAELRITLLRSPVYAGTVAHMDLGRQTINYTLLPHQGSWRQAGVWRHAEELNSPAEYVWETEHSGELPGRFSFAALDKPNVQWTVLKKHEDSDRWVIRLVERHGEKGTAEVRLPCLGGRLQIPMKPYEIKTCLVERAANRLIWRETDMLERTETATKGKER